jgi:tetratricopeptide (TPR) repeat protein
MQMNHSVARIFGDRMILLALAGGALLAAVPLWAQATPPAEASTLQGVVRDSERRPIAGAIVSLQTKDAQPITALTDEAGAYGFSVIGEGVYTVRAEKPGYHDAKIDAINLGRNNPRMIDLTLNSGKTSASQSAPPSRPEFFDEPNFTVAGVTDTTVLGGHGSSEPILRSQEALAKETAALRKSSSDDKADSIAAQHHSRAEEDEQEGKPLEAVREYQRAAELNPSESNIFDWGSELLLHRAAEPAVEVFTRGNRLFPHSVLMLTGLGAAWYAMGSFDQAVQRLCAASDLNPNDAEPYLFLGRMQAVQSTEPEAMAERLARFARLQPESAQANYYYAISVWKRRSSPGQVEKLPQVKSLLEKAIRLDPKLAPAYFQLGILYSEQRDFLRAIAAYRQAIEIDPQLDQAHYRLAQAYRQTGEATKSQEELRLYEQISKQKAEETGRQLHQQQQFVYELRDQPSAAQPK